MERWGLLQVEVICQGLDFEEVFSTRVKGFNCPLWGLQALLTLLCGSLSLGVLMIRIFRRTSARKVAGGAAQEDDEGIEWASGSCGFGIWGLGMFSVVEVALGPDFRRFCFGREWASVGAGSARRRLLGPHRKGREGASLGSQKVSAGSVFEVLAFTERLRGHIYDRGEKTNPPCVLFHS